MARIAALIDRVMSAPDDLSVAAQVRSEVTALARAFPLYPRTRD